MADDEPAALDAYVRALVRLLHARAEALASVVGWPPKDVGEVLHDGFIPEFAWEFLCG